MAQARTPSSGELADAPEQLLAAEDVRMPTEHQQYSTQNQVQTIREYVERRGIRIVKTYSDDAKSGLIISGRTALQQMIADVESGEAELSVILVYDVTRWGRFQDTNESAYYEYRCRKAEMQVAYCAGQFENDGSPNSTIIKRKGTARPGGSPNGLDLCSFPRTPLASKRKGGPRNCPHIFNWLRALHRMRAVERSENIGPERPLLRHLA